MIALYLAGPVAGMVIAVVYWCGRAIDRRRRAERELLESPGAKALAERMRDVFGRRGLTDAERRVRPWPPPPEPTKRQDTLLSEPEPHIEVLKLRAMKIYMRLPIGPDEIVRKAIESGDRDALLAILREETG